MVWYLGKKYSQKVWKKGLGRNGRKGPGERVRVKFPGRKVR